MTKFSWPEQVQQAQEIVKRRWITKAKFGSNPSFNVNHPGMRRDADHLNENPNTVAAEKEALKIIKQRQEDAILRRQKQIARQ